MTFIILLISYLIGSIPTAYLLVKYFNGHDIRKIGSGNMGASNVLRSGKTILAILTFVVDLLKGFTPVYFVEHFALNTTIPLLAGMFAILGHIFPVWLRFKGGKGVSTTVGVLFSISYKIGLLFILTWLITLLISRYYSVSSILAVLISTLASIFFIKGNSLIILVIIAVLVIIKHSENIKRLLYGKENKLIIKKNLKKD